MHAGGWEGPQGLTSTRVAKGRMPKAGILFHKVCHHTMRHWEPPILYLWD